MRRNLDCVIPCTYDGHYCMYQFTVCKFCFAFNSCVRSLSPGAWKTAESQTQFCVKNWRFKCSGVKHYNLSSIQIDFIYTFYFYFILFYFSHLYRFHKCLRQVRNTVSYDVGNMYFNILTSQCFVVRQKKQCVENGWWGKCNKYEKRPTALLRQPRAFPKTLKRNRSGRTRKNQTNQPWNWNWRVLIVPNWRAVFRLTFVSRESKQSLYARK